jgi:hypothetical protein
MESTVILCYCPWRSHTHCLFSSLLSRSFTCSKFDYHGFEHGFLGFFRVRFFSSYVESFKCFFFHTFVVCPHILHLLRHVHLCSRSFFLCVAQIG